MLIILKISSQNEVKWILKSIAILLFSSKNNWVNKNKIKQLKDCC